MPTPHWLLSMIASALLMTGLAVRVSAGPGVIQQPATPNPSGASCDAVTLPAGWNLIAGVWANDLEARHLGPLYTYAAGDRGYRVMTVPYGLWDLSDYTAGYWVDLPSPVQVRGACHLPPGVEPPSSPQPITIAVGAGWTMISAPFNGFVVDHTIQGADAAFIFDPISGQYQQTQTLPAGQGAWVYSSTGAEVTLIPSP
jgi:hypothetical protein